MHQRVSFDFQQGKFTEMFRFKISTGPFRIVPIASPTYVH
jgi:hypothetical protein